MSSPGPTLPSEIVAEFCLRHRIARLWVFGSAARGEAGPGSDIDVLVEFEPNHCPGLIRLAAMECELADTLKQPVDLMTPGFFGEQLRRSVLAEARLEYDAA